MSCFWERLSKGEETKPLYGRKITCGCEKCQKLPRMEYELKNKRVTIFQEKTSKIPRN